MSDETIVAIYDTPAHAELAAADLREAGVPETAIGIHAGKISAARTGTTAAAPSAQGFWSSLFGGSPDHDTTVYDRSVDNGASVLTVKTPNAYVSRVMAIIESHSPIDIDERATSLGLRPNSDATPAAAPSTPPQPGMMQLSEENLNIGKRLVNRGGTRVRRFVVERPVEEQVSLHTENVVLDRHPVTDARPASDSFTEKAIEMMEMVEEVVVSKSAHVYEEVGLRKETTDRVQTVRDTVRKEEVEIQHIPGSDTLAKTGSTPKH